MELRDYLAVIGRRKWLITINVVLVVATAVIATLFIAPTYTASTTIRLATPQSLSGDLTSYLDRLQNTYSNLASSTDLRDQLKRQLGLKTRPTTSLKLEPNTELMSLSAKARTAALAAREADLAASLLVSRARELGTQTLAQSDKEFQAQLSALETQIAAARAQYDTLIASGSSSSAVKARINDLKTDIDIKTAAAVQQQAAYQQTRSALAERTNLLSVVEPAAIPTSPSSPKMKLSIALGLVVGLISGLGLAFLLENLNTRMEGTDEIERTAALPVLGAIPKAKSSSRGLFNSDSPAEEAFRRLRTNVLALGRTEEAGTLLITSAEPNEGKSTVVANLATSLVQSGLKVVVVDGDLRMPTIHTIFNLPNDIGFGDVLDGTAKLDSALVRPWKKPCPWVLPSGGPFEHPAELLASPRAREVFADLASRFDITLIDSPALLATADALSLATEVPAVLIVVGRSQTRREALLSVRKQLLGVSARPVGVVVNRAEDVPAYHYYQRR
jgi:succinoglycan biosynthesis transport protein ExoP